MRKWKDVNECPKHRLDKPRSFNKLSRDLAGISLAPTSTAYKLTYVSLLSKPIGQIVIFICSGRMVFRYVRVQLYRKSHKNKVLVSLNGEMYLIRMTKRWDLTVVFIQVHQSPIRACFPMLTSPLL